MLRQLKERDNKEIKIGLAVENERIIKMKIGYAKDRVSTLVKDYVKWLKDNNMEAFNEDILELINQYT